MEYTLEFEKAQPATIDKPAGVIRMWVNVWGNRERGHVMIGAPTLEALKHRWEQITNADFDPALAQHVIVTSVSNVNFVDASIREGETP